MSTKKSQPAAIQFHGIGGATKSCVHALVRLINCGPGIVRAALLTHKNRHCFLLRDVYDDLIAIKSGFTSGYSGEGPRGLSTALQLLERHGVDIDEFEVRERLLSAVDETNLTLEELKEIGALSPVRPTQWHDYCHYEDTLPGFNHHHLNRQFPITVPFGLLDPRLTDLALSFKVNPDNALITAARRLEDHIRKRTGLHGEESTRLFAKAFHPDTPLLTWKGVRKAEHIGRANLFHGFFMAFRNPRAHNEQKGDLQNAMRELLLLNELFILESNTIRKRKSSRNNKASRGETDE